MSIATFSWQEGAAVLTLPRESTDKRSDVGVSAPAIASNRKFSPGIYTRVVATELHLDRASYIFRSTEYLANPRRFRTQRPNTVLVDSQRNVLAGQLQVYLIQGTVSLQGCIWYRH